MNAGVNSDSALRGRPQKMQALVLPGTAVMGNRMQILMDGRNLVLRRF